MIEELKKQIEELKKKLQNVQSQAMSLAEDLEIEQAQHNMDEFNSNPHAHEDEQPQHSHVTFIVCDTCGCIMKDDDLYCLSCPEP